MMTNSFNAGAAALVAAFLVSGVAGGLAGALTLLAFGGTTTTGEQAAGAAALVAAVVAGVATFRLLRRRSRLRESETTCRHRSV